MKKMANEPTTSNPQSQPSLKFIDMPVVLLGEDSTEYAQLRQQIEDYVRPLDIFEKMYVSDLAYYSWDSLRYRKAVTKLIDSSRKAGPSTSDRAASSVGKAQTAGGHRGAAGGLARF